ncbi:MAG: sulfur reduction protein DsrE, partial [Lacticaseibacillus paracasei]
SLQQRHLDETKLPAGVPVVPVGVVKLAQAEAAGYGYIKP